MRSGWDEREHVHLLSPSLDGSLNDAQGSLVSSVPGRAGQKPAMQAVCPHLYLITNPQADEGVSVPYDSWLVRLIPKSCVICQILVGTWIFYGGGCDTFSSPEEVPSGSQLG